MLSVYIADDEVWITLGLKKLLEKTGIDTEVIGTANNGLVAKEEVVGVFGVLDFEGLTRLAGYSFLAFNLLCAPCFAAIGAIRREMNNPKWTLFAVGYQCVFAYAVSLMIFQIGSIFTGNVNVIGLIFALAVLGLMCFMLFRPAPKEKLHHHTA